MDILRDVTRELYRGITNKLDDKLKEACLIWGVDITNHKEVSERCEIIYTEGDDRREVRIDGTVVMLFTDIRPKPFTFKEPFKVSAEFNCSEILKPEDLII